MDDDEYREKKDGRKRKENKRRWAREREWKVEKHEIWRLILFWFFICSVITHSSNSLSVWLRFGVSFVRWFVLLQEGLNATNRKVNRIQKGIIKYGWFGFRIISKISATIEMTFHGHTFLTNHGLLVHNYALKYCKAMGRYYLCAVFGYDQQLSRVCLCVDGKSNFL